MSQEGEPRRREASAPEAEGAASSPKADEAKTKKKKRGGFLGGLLITGFVLALFGATAAAAR